MTSNSTFDSLQSAASDSIYPQRHRTLVSDMRRHSSESFGHPPPSAIPPARLEPSSSILPACSLGWARVPRARGVRINSLTQTAQGALEPLDLFLGQTCLRLERVELCSRNAEKYWRARLISLMAWYGYSGKKVTHYLRPARQVSPSPLPTAPPPPWLHVLFSSRRRRSLGGGDRSALASRVSTAGRYGMTRGPQSAVPNGAAH